MAFLAPLGMAAARLVGQKLLQTVASKGGQALAQKGGQELAKKTMSQQAMHMAPKALEAAELAGAMGIKKSREKPTTESLSGKKTKKGNGETWEQGSSEKNRGIMSEGGAEASKSNSKKNKGFMSKAFSSALGFMK